MAAWPVRFTGIGTHAALVRRATQSIRNVERALMDPDEDVDPVEQSERGDIIRGAFEIAARKMTTEQGSYLNTSNRSGSPDAFSAGTTALEQRMEERFRNKVAGRGTHWLMKKEVERYQDILKKQEQQAREGGRNKPQAVKRVQQTKMRLAQWKAMVAQGSDRAMRARKKWLEQKRKVAQQEGASGSSSSSAGGPTIFTDLDRVLNEEPQPQAMINDGREGGVRVPRPLGVDIDVQFGEGKEDEGGSTGSTNR